MQETKRRVGRNKESKLKQYKIHHARHKRNQRTEEEAGAKSRNKTVDRMLKIQRVRTKKSWEHEEQNRRKDTGRNMRCMTNRTEQNR